MQIERSLFYTLFTTHTIERIGYSKYEYPHGYPDSYPNQYPKIHLPKFGFGYGTMKMDTY